MRNSVPRDFWADQICHRHRALHRTGLTVAALHGTAFVLVRGGSARRRTGIRDSVYGRVCEKCFVVFRGVVGADGCPERYLGYFRHLLDPVRAMVRNVPKLDRTGKPAQLWGDKHPPVHTTGYAEPSLG
jgi:hypothetical protein